MTSPPPAQLAIDLGASSGRVIAGTLDGSRLSLETVHRFPNEPVRVQDSLQWDVLALWREVQRGLALGKGRFPEIRSVGVDTWGVDYVLLDRQNKIAGPVWSHRDPRTRGALKRAFETVPREEIFRSTGVQFMEINTLYQLLASAWSDDPALKIARSFLMMGDFFHWLLSGERAVERTNASTTQMLDARTKRWAEPMLERLGLPTEIFGRLLEPGSQVGVVQPSVAGPTGLEGVPVVVPATHDTASAVLAVPADGFAPAKPDWCYISSGTWSLMGCELPEPRIDRRCSELNFTNEGGVRGSTRLLKNIGGLWIFQQIRAALERRGSAESWDEMVLAASKARPFAVLIDPDDPSFLAPPDMVEAIANYAERTGQTVPGENATLYRAALEGLALRYRTCLGMLETLVEHTIDTIHVVGGGSLNALLCQMTADACNRVVVAGPVEATAAGNVLMQMLGGGHLKTIEEARELVRRSFEVTRYEPQSPERWVEPAERFTRLG